jgi:hypothetical protein
MLTRSNQVAPQQEYYADSLLTQPSLSQSVFHNMAMSFATPIVALNMLDKDFAKKPDGKAMLDSFNAIRLENETPGMSTSQWLTGEGAGMLGFMLNPATWALGGVGDLAASGIAKGVGSVGARYLPDAASVFMRTPIKNLVAEPIGRFIPESIGKKGSEKALSFGLMADTTLQNFGAFAGAGIPQGIVDNFKADTGHIEWGGVAREAGEMGAFGMAIGSIPFAWGILRGKINRGLGKAPTDAVDMSSLNEALEKGRITPEEHRWYADYLEHQKNPGDAEATEKLKARASDLINQNGHRANTVSNEAMFDILTPNDVTNLHGVIADQLASAHMPGQQRLALSDFIVHNRMDYIRQKPEWLDGVRGYVDFINQKLEARSSKTAEADDILGRHLTRGVKDNMPFSQKELFKHMKKAGFEASHIAHLPVTIPENMTKRMGMLEKIGKLKQKIKQQKPKDIKSLFRGRSDTTFGYKSLKEAGVKEIDLAKDDIEFGKGFWYAESAEHAKKYGSTIEKIEGEYKIFDVDKTKDKELKELYSEIHKRYTTGDLLKYPKPEGYVLTSQLIKQFTEKLKAKGFEGIRRNELAHDNYGRPEIMFFNKPQSSKKAIPNKQTLRRIEELESKLPKILTPKEELEHIRGKLLGEKGLPKNFERSNAYHRLLDLSNVWHNARTLLDRVHLENEYNRQSAFRDVAHQVLRIADSDMGALAKPENVMDYLKNRIEGQIGKIEPIEELNAEVAAKMNVPADSDAILNEQELQVKETKAEDAKNEFAQSSDRFKEFKKSENIFKNLISCVMGGLGG